MRSYPAAKPTAAAAYAHHPFGSYYLFAISRALFGRHEWAIRLVPVLVSASMPALLFSVGRRLYGALGGAITALGWTVLPIALSFAQFPSFEMFALASMLLITLVALRLDEQPSRARLLMLLGVVAIALHSDWLAYFYLALVLVVATLVVAFGPPRETEPLLPRRFLQCLLLVGGIVTVTLLAYVRFFDQAGLLKDWLSSADVRAQGNDTPLRLVLQQRRYWIEVMFTKPGIVFGILGAVLMLGRLILLHRLSDGYPLLMLLTAAVHYIHFKSGADVHIYWPLPFAAQFCFGLGAIALTIQELGRWLAQRQNAKLADVGASRVALGICAVVLLSVLPDGLRALEYSRNSGCRLNDDGQLNLQDLDKNLALEFMKTQVPEGKPVTLQASMAPNWSEDWALERPTVMNTAVGLTMFTAPRHVFQDVRFAAPTAAVWGIQNKTTVVGPFWLVDTEAMPSEFRVYGFEEKQPSLLQRMFVQAHDPIRRVVEDPYRTWEFRHHLSLKPNPEPPGLDSKEQLRLLHNVLIAKGDGAGAARVRFELEGSIEKRSARDFDGGLKLMGHRLVPGVVPKLEVYFLAAGSVGPEAFFDVRSRVIAVPFGSMVVRDDKVKRYGVGFEIHPSLWKPGMIYVSSVELRPRPGRERFYAL
ncbi:MAG TPA: glycosyltransferase family 39 protein, partial [Polyangiaceae bacterium]